METSKTICGKCGKEFEGNMSYLPAHEPCIKIDLSPRTVDVQFETAYGQTTRLPFVIRCF